LPGFSGSTANTPFHDEEIDDAEAKDSKWDFSCYIRDSLDFGCQVSSACHEEVVSEAEV
jgi:hypothetical protein